MASLLDRVKSALPASKGSGPALPSASQRTFAYVAMSPRGDRTKGRMQAPSVTLVSDALQTDGWIPLRIQEVSSTGLDSDVFAMIGSKDVRLSVQEQATFSRQISELLKVGVPLGSALRALGEDTTPGLAAICEDLTERTASGVPLSEALRAHPKAFDDVFCAYVAAGEAAGALPQSMARLATTLERKASMALKIRSVTAYPKMVGGAVTLVVSAILIFMVPMFSKIYADFGKELPLPTRIVMGITDNVSPVTWSQTITGLTPWFLERDAELSLLGIVGRVAIVVVMWVLLERRRMRRNKALGIPAILIRVALSSFILLFTYQYKFNPISVLAWAVAGTLVGVPYLWLRAQRSNPARASLIDKAKFRAPVFGRIAWLSTLYRWCTTLSGGLESGVNVAASLEIAGKATGSQWFAVVTPYLQAAVRSGRPLSEALMDYKDLFPPQVRAMVTTGEAAGDMPIMLDNVADSIDAEVNTLIAGLSARLEVILLLVMGVVVGGLIAVLYLPILNLAATAGGL